MSKPRRSATALEADPLWYKDAVVYEVHVRAFCDSNGDGVGDFPGLTQKLDYLQDIGTTVIWLLPFYPSPLRDDGYDIADYTDVHTAYGSLQDFRQFIKEAHRRGLRVITELVLNHTSDQHAWFQRARRSPPGSHARAFYVWSESPERYKEARVIFKDFESSNWAWDPVAKAYYWHRFYTHQPDLNYDHPAVRKAMLQVVNFWMELGVDGLRLDAVPYLYEREGTHCENLPQTHALLKELRRHVDQRFSGRMLLAEANQWPEDAAAYFGKGDECHMAFHFPLMPRLFMASRQEERFPILEILQQTPPIPESAQWGLFLRNHDELTLEMVTDEERDYLYRIYASDPQMRVNVGIRRRLAPLLWNNRRKIELMNGLLLSMPGTPFIYYGDEIGMGDNVYLGDRNGVRTPMQWSADRNAGFSRANPQKLYLPVVIDPEYHYEAVNVEAQQNNPSSLLWWMKRLLALRKRYHAFGRGTIEFLNPENRKLLAFLRRYQDETILVVANLSRFTQHTELNLSACKGLVPIELFGHTVFPAIGESPYFLTLGPHAFHWFALQPETEPEAAAGAPASPLPQINLEGDWSDLFTEERSRAALERLLPSYLKRHRWFGAKAKAIQSVTLTETIPVMDSAVAALLKVSYTEGEPETYLLPIAFAADPQADSVARECPKAVLAQLRLQGSSGLLYDAVWDRRFRQALLEAIDRRRRLKGRSGLLQASPTQFFRKGPDDSSGAMDSALLGAEQSNTSIVYGNRFILKLFRRLEEGLNPDLEIGRFLSEQCAFRYVPPVAGFLEYRRGTHEPITVGSLQQLVPNEGDAWQYTLEVLGSYFERVLSQPEELRKTAPPSPSLMELLGAEADPRAGQLTGTYLQTARLLGARSAQLHRALASSPGSAGFAPEPFSTHYQRSIYQSMRNLTVQVLSLLKRQVNQLSPEIRPEAARVLGLEPKIQKRFQALLNRRITAMRIRCHGDFHLGQVLYTGNDFVFLDFEGEPARPLSERRIKRSPLRDVAGMLRSFHYAAYTVLFGPRQTQGPAAGVIRPEDVAGLEPWAQGWSAWASAAFLKAYLEEAAGASFLPKTQEELACLLEAYLLEKAVYELGYELNNRPDWVRVPLRSIAHFLNASAEIESAAKEP